jgi:hypothetical protein
VRELALNSSSVMVYIEIIPHAGGSRGRVVQ